jgi:hypothetical protein
VGMSLHVKMPFYFLDVKSPQVVQMVSISKRNHSCVKLNMISNMQVLYHF